MTRLVQGSLGCALAVLLAVAAMPALARLDKTTAQALDAAIAGEHRSAENKARDAYRKPREVLEFLGLKSTMTVVEMSPGAGWYTQILAPVLKDEGRLYAAQFALNGGPSYQRRLLGRFFTMLGDAPELYGSLVVTHFAPPYQLEIAPRESADMVLTFRNVHNWAVRSAEGHSWGHLAFRAMYDALKPGGVLGIVDHRWPDAANEDPQLKNGYISEDTTIALAKSVGFTLAARSDLLRNPKDTHDHPKGVWTLPPSLTLGDADREKYLAIGESDRFLLKFVKPQ